MESKKKTGGSSGQEEFGALREMEALRGHGVIIVLLCYSGRPIALYSCTLSARGVCTFAFHSRAEKLAEKDNACNTKRSVIPSPPSTIPYL